MARPRRPSPEPARKAPTTCDAYVDALANDSPEANAQLAYLHSRLLRRATRRIPQPLHGIIDPEQAVQDVWELLARKDKSLPVKPDEGALTRWMFHALDQRITDLIRRQSAEKRGGGKQPISLSPVDTNASHLPVPAPIETPSQDARANEIVEIARKRLTPDEFLVWYGIEVRGEKAAEFATQIGRSPSAVRGLLARALKHLRDVLGAE